MTYNKYQVENTLYSTWIASISSSNTVILCKLWEESMFASTPNWYPLILEEYNSDDVCIAREIVKFVSRSSNSLTITRAFESCIQDDSSTIKTRTQNALAFNSWFKISLQMTKEIIKDIQDEVTRLETDKFNKSWWALTWLLQKAKSTNIASATTTNLANATGNTVHITWTTTITWFWTLQAGVKLTLIFDWILTLTHNATSLILPTWANIITVAWDSLEIVSEWSWNWRVVNYTKKDWSALTWTTFEVTRVKFGWDWSDWNLTISSWTTSLSLVSNFLVKNYDNITISWTAILNITWATWTGWIAVIKCKWNLTMSWWNIQMNWQWWQWWVARVSWWVWDIWQRGINLLEALTTNAWAWWQSWWPAWAWVTVPLFLNKWLVLYKRYSTALQCWAWGWSWNFYSAWSSWAWWWGWWILIIEVWGAINFTSWIIEASWWVWWNYTWWQCWWGWWGWWGSVLICYNILTSTAWTLRANWWNWWSWYAAWTYCFGWYWWWWTATWWNWNNWATSWTAWSNSSYWTWWTSGAYIWWGWWAWFVEVIKNTEFA